MRFLAGLARPGDARFAELFAEVFIFNVKFHFLILFSKLVAFYNRLTKNIVRRTLCSTHRINSQRQYEVEFRQQ